MGWRLKKREEKGSFRDGKSTRQSAMFL